MNGKGSRPRNNFSKKFRDNYDDIFSRKEKSKTSTRPENVFKKTKKIDTK